MKNQLYPTLRHFLAITGSSLLALSSAVADDGTWIGDTNTDSQWTNTALWQDGIIADGTGFTAFFTNDITAARTVSLNGVDRTIGNITFTDATPSHDLTISGNILTLDVTTGAPIIDVTQSGRTLSITSVVAGSDGLQKDGAGILSLNGTNTFTGNISINEGTLRIGNHSTGASLGSGTYAGNISIASGASLHFFSRADQTLTGIISGDGNLTKSSDGVLTLGNNNTYTGRTLILPQSGGRPGGTLSVSSLNSVNDGTPLMASSSLGAPTTVANGTITIGAQGVGQPASLVYTGTGETTDRVIDFRFNNNGSVHTISNMGEGLLKFTSTPTSNRSINAGSGGIVLSGDGDGEFTEGIPIGVSITKSGSGTWTLGGPVGNGAITVSAGILTITGATQGTSAITLNGGSLGLDTGFPVTADNAAVDLTNGTITVTGGTGAPSYTLLTAASITGTPVLAAPVPGYELQLANGDTELRLVDTGGASPYDTWSGGAAFDADASGDGVSNGLAFLLGANGPNESALDLLPTVSESGGNLIMTFTCLAAADRGTATLQLEYDGDLAGKWLSVPVPGAVGAPNPIVETTATGSVSFVATDGGTNDNGAALINIVATISDATESASGKLFGRLMAEE